MSPTLVVSQPLNNAQLPLDQPFVVSGQAWDKGFPEPVRVVSVTVQVDDQPPVDATRTFIPDKTKLVIGFKASVEVTNGQDPHTVSVTATNENGLSTTRTAAVFTGPAFTVTPPAVLIEFSPFGVDLSDPKITDAKRALQNGLTSLSRLLASAGRMLIGPNLLVSTNSLGQPVLRLGLWIEDPASPVVAATPTQPLPVLPDAAAAAGFSTVPLLLENSAGFGLSVPVSTLQELLDAIAPAIKTAASQQDVSIDSITATTVPPGSVLTTVSGKLPIPVPFAGAVPFTITISETLGRVPSPTAAGSVPAIVGSDHSSSVGDALDWFIGFADPLLYLALVAAVGLVAYKAGETDDQVTGAAAPLIAALPSSVPFRNTAMPGPGLDIDFPVIYLNWTALGVTVADIVGTGVYSIGGREQSEVSMRVDGRQRITAYQEDVAGGSGQAYTITLVNLAPDADKFTWATSGTATHQGTIVLDDFSQTALAQVVFKLPLHVLPGTYPFGLTINATETCGTDPTKTLSASVSMDVEIVVLENPPIPS